MEAYNIVEAKKEKDRSISWTMFDPAKGIKYVRRFADIRGGIHWPTSSSPACFVILGQEYVQPVLHDKKQQPGQRKVISVYVNESIGMEKFYAKLLAACQKMLCSNLYALLPEDRSESGYLNDLNKFASDCDGIIFVGAAHTENDFLLTVSRIRDSLDNGNLIIPEDTIVFDQLSNISREDLQDNLEERFYAIDALGHVLDSFYRHPPRIRPLISRLSAVNDW